jgi:hypothetical protein
VLRQGFYRSKVVVTYAFEKQSGENILVRQSVHFTVRNVCAKDDFADFPLKGRVDLKPLHTAATEWDAQLGLIRLTAGGEDVPLDRIRRETDPDTRAYSWEALEKRAIGYQKTLEVFAEHKVVKHDHDAAVWSSTIPSTDIELCVTWEEPIRLRFAFSAMHPEFGTLTPKREVRRLT